MRIFFDHFMFSTQKYGGVSKYLSEIIKHLPDDNSCYVSIWLSNNVHLKELGYTPRAFFPNNNYRAKRFLMNVLNMPNTIWQLRRQSYDVFHHTSIVPYIYAFAPKHKPQVRTLHDAAIFQYYQKDFMRKPYIRMEKHSLQHVDHCIAISEYTKQEYIKYYGIDEKKITVIHHGVEKASRLPQEPYTRLVENPYVLYVGLRHDYKNFERFIRAFTLLTQQFPELKCVCTGHPFSNEEIQLLQSLGILDKVVQMYATEQQLAMLYHDAEMFVYPSLYEGFGLPILEAMKYQCPIVLANATCFPEVAGSAGHFFDPLQIEDIAEKMRDVLSDSVLRQNLINQGKQRLENFSWEKSAAEHLKVYQSLIR